MVKILFVIPTYNEANNIGRLINKLTSIASNQGHLHYILVVDDNSPDGTYKLVEDLRKNDRRIFLLRRMEKLGLGSAYMEGFDWALKNIPFEILIQMDADFSHSPKEVLRIADPIMNGFDVSIASRYIKYGGSKNWPFHRKLISKSANFLARNLLKIHVKDITSGFRAMNKKAVSGLLDYHVNSRGYSFQFESLLIYEYLGLKIKEVPFIFERRAAGKAKLSILEILQFVLSLIKLSIYGPKLKNIDNH